MKIFISVSSLALLLIFTGCSHVEDKDKENKEIEEFSKKEKCMNIGRQFVLDRYGKDFNNMQHAFNSDLNTCLTEVASGSYSENGIFLEIYDTLTGELIGAAIMNDEVFKKKNDGIDDYYTQQYDDFEKLSESLFSS